MRIKEDINAVHGFVEDISKEWTLDNRVDNILLIGKNQGAWTVLTSSKPGGFIQTVVGYKTPSQLEIYLKMIANDDYKELTTTEAWQEYQNSFKNTFK